MYKKQGSRVKGSWDYGRAGLSRGGWDGCFCTIAVRDGSVKSLFASTIIVFHAGLAVCMVLEMAW
jgi:hypothetical protein